MKYHYLRDQQIIGTINISHVPSESQIADIFTKPLPATRFCNLRSQLGVVNETLEKCDDWSPNSPNVFLFAVQFKEVCWDQTTKLQQKKVAEPDLSVGFLFSPILVSCLLLLSSLLLIWSHVSHMYVPSEWYICDNYDKSINRYKTIDYLIINNKWYW